jgi:hypothetical protein
VEESSLALLSEVRVGSFLVYIPRPTTADHQKWRDIVLRVKQDAASSTPGMTMTEFAASRLREELPGTVLEPFFGNDVILVPAPKSSVLIKGGLWPTKKLADRIIAEGLAGHVLPCLERAQAVPKAAYARPGERPTASRHHETIRVNGQLVEPRARLLLVDDVITKGSTLLACATLLHEAFPEAEIRAFALARTLSYGPFPRDIVDPHVSTVRPDLFGDANRTD